MRDKVLEISSVSNALTHVNQGMRDVYVNLKRDCFTCLEAQTDSHDANDATAAVSD